MQLRPKCSSLLYDPLLFSSTATLPLVPVTYPAVSTPQSTPAADSLTSNQLISLNFSSRSLSRTQRSHLVVSPQLSLSPLCNSASTARNLRGRRCIFARATYSSIFKLTPSVYNHIALVQLTLQET
ncbi:hypothetical protein BDW75DRAFT_108567 [Aspergillus navahoensis]